MAKKTRERDPFSFQVGRYKGRSTQGTPPVFRHPECEFQLFLSGTGAYFIKNRTYRVGKNSLIFINCNQIHHYLPHPDSCIERLNLLFNPGLLKLRPAAAKIFRRFRKWRHLVLSEKEATAARFLLEEIRAENDSNLPYRDEICLDNIEKLLIIFYRCGLRGGKTERQVRTPFIQQLLGFIENSFTSEISLARVAKRFNRSPFSISRLFKKYLGIGFKEYLISRRIDEAKHLLEESQKSVSSIAYTTGFRDLSTFNERFRRLTGHTPTSYRTSVRAGRLPEIKNPRKMKT